MPAEMPPNSYVRLYGVRYREAWRAAEVCVYLELARPRPCKDMPIQGCFAFIDWEPRFARAEFCLIADTPEHGLLPAAPNSSWGIDRGWDARGYGRLHGPRCRDRCAAHFNRAGPKLCRRPPEQPNRSCPCVSTFAPKNPTSPGCSPKCRRGPCIHPLCG
jgi:hypothetical protein